MNNTLGTRSYWILLFLLAFSFLAFAAPISAHAQTAQTVQVVPPGPNTCGPIPVTGFTTYVYDGALNSFEFSIPDSTYVALTGSVGNTAIPFQFMTRRVDASGILRVHVDIPSIPVKGTLPITVTLLGTHGGGQPVCAAIVSLTVGSGAIQNIPSAPAAPSQPSSGASTGPAKTTVVKKTTTPAASGSASSATGSATSSGYATSATSATSAPIFATTKNSIQNMCGTETGAYRLWLVLLVLYALLVGALLWAEWPISWGWIRAPQWLTAGILVPLVLLLLFWYLSVSCRAAWWMPVVAVVIGIAGIAAAFWNHPKVNQILFIGEGNKA